VLVLSIEKYVFVKQPHVSFPGTSTIISISKDCRQFSVQFMKRYWAMSVNTDLPDACEQNDEAGPVGHMLNYGGQMYPLVDWP
jgi:hypothetical protein